jgi:hypothetical protein
MRRGVTQGGCEEDNGRFELLMHKYWYMQEGERVRKKKKQETGIGTENERSRVNMQRCE